MDKITYALSKKYTDNSVAGGGISAGKNCTIDSVTEITGGHRVTFGWYLDNGTHQTTTMDVMDGEQGPQGETGAKGDTGATGATGATGSAATIEVGSVVSGVSPSVLNVGTTSAAVFNFVLPRGEKGDPGADGQDGKSFEIKAQYASYADLVAAHPTGSAGDAYFVGSDNNPDLYVWLSDTSEWYNAGKIAGVKGDTGDDGYSPSASVSKSGSKATISITDKNGTTTAEVSDGIDGEGVPAGGATGSYLKKKSNTDYDTGWGTLGTAAALDVPASGNASATEVVKGDDTRLSDARNAADVSAWAKAADKPTYTANEVGAVATTSVGAANGVAELDSTGKVPSSQLPSYVDDVVEGYYKESDGKFYEDNAYTTEIVGEAGKIYVSVDTNIQYRWTGSAFSALGGALTLGETSSTAYRGDRGKTAYDFSQNPATSTPSMDGTAAVGSSGKWAREDHVHPSDTAKADKVSSATNGNFAGLDANGNLTDSGKKASDFLTQHQDITGKQDKTLATSITVDGTSQTTVEGALGAINTLAASNKTALSNKVNTSDIIATSKGGTGNANGYIQTGKKANTTIGTGATAEGTDNTASGDYSHAEGVGTTASNSYAHAEGIGTTASGQTSHAEGDGTIASGKRSHASGLETVAGYSNQTVVGTYNNNKSSTIFEVGNGDAGNRRNNAFEVYSDGTFSQDNGSSKFKFTQNSGVDGYYDASGTWHAFGSGGSSVKKTRYTITASSWSASANASGYYTYSLTLNPTLKTTYAPEILCTGADDSTLPTNIQRSMYRLLSYIDNTAINTLILYAKVKPTSTFYIWVKGEKA